MKILIDKKDKAKVKKVLANKGILAVWEGYYLLVHESKEDEIVDTLFDAGIDLILSH